MIPVPVDMVLLAGGGSRRFGGDKAAAKWRGRTLAEHVLAARPPGPGRTVLVLSRKDDPRPARTDAVAWDDPDLPPGPLRGVIAGLKACDADRAWVTACDLPGLRPAVLELLRDAARPGDAAVVPEHDGRLQPLCALYAVSAVGALLAAQDDGVRSLTEAVERLPIRRLAPARLDAVDPEGASFLNVNRPEDLDRLDERLELES